MSLPRQHTWNCLYFGNDADCVTCHPQLTCKNCGHTASKHSYSDKPAVFGWCPGCQGCGLRPQQEEKTIMKQMLITMTDGQAHLVSFEPQKEEYFVKMFCEAINQKVAISFANQEGEVVAFNGAYIMSFKVAAA